MFFNDIYSCVHAFFTRHPGHKHWESVKHRYGLIKNNLAPVQYEFTENVLLLLNIELVT